MNPTELTTFPSFPLLPTEIRTMIWNLAIHSLPGRAITLRSTPPPYPPNSPPEITSHTPIPAPLHTCHLSRQLSQERWRLGVCTSAAAEKKVYVDAMTDSVYFPNWPLLSLWLDVGDWAYVVRVGEGDDVYVGRSNVYVVTEAVSSQPVRADLWSHSYMPRSWR